jgi:hypothetical protein
LAQTATDAVGRLRAASCKSGFIEVEDDQQRLGGKKLEAAQPLEIVAL